MFEFIRFYSPIIQAFIPLLAVIIPILFGVMLKPRYCILGFLLVPALTPKQFFFQFSGNSVAVYIVIELLFAAGILISLVNRRYSLNKLDVPRYLKNFFILVVVMYLFSTVIPIFLPYVPLLNKLLFLYAERPGDFYSHLFTLSIFLSGLMFFYGIMAYVKSKEDIEAILKVFVIIGIIAAAENIFLYHFNLAGIKEYFVSDYTSYNSLIIGPTDFFGRFMLLPVFSSLYFIYSTKKKKYLLLHLIFLIPVFDTRQRGTLLGLIVGYLFLLIFYSRKKIRNAYFAGLFGLFIFLILEFYGTSFIFEYREDIFQLKNLMGRFMIWQRAADTFIYTFPFGTGVGYVHEALGLTDIPTHIPLIGDRFIAARYFNIIAGIRAPSVHNLWVEYICEHGLLGLISFMLLIYLFIYTVRQQRKLYFKSPRWRNNMFKCCGSMFAGFAVSQLTQSIWDFYGIIFMLFSLNAILVHKAKNISKTANTNAITKVTSPPP